jgi:hypothetical protein
VNGAFKRELIKLLVLAGLTGVSPARADVGVVTPNGQQLANYLNSFQVQNWWPPIPVNWQTGSPNTPTPPSPNTTLTGTHCSCFTTAAANPLGIYILRPPIYPDGWHDMANYQDLWYKTNYETSYGWIVITNSPTNMIVAQDLANQGNLVIACYLNPDINDSGHTAVIFPYSNTVANINAVGPEECQAGAYNYNLTNVMTGFNQHPGAFPSSIDYFYHPVTYPITPVNPVLNSVSVTNGVLSCQVSSLVGRNYKLQITTNFINWITVASYLNPNNLITLFTTTNLTVTAPQTCSFGVQVTDPYGITSQVVTQSVDFTGIILSGSSPMNVTLGSAFVDPGATAVEDCTTNLVVTTSGSVNTNVPGSYTLTYTATTSDDSQLVATRTVNVTGFNLSYETILATNSWSEDFDELGNTTNSLLPTGWVFAQGLSMPIYSASLDAPAIFSTSSPQTWTNVTTDQNSKRFTRCSDSTTNQTLTSGGRVNCGDASTDNTNRAVGFATSNPSWVSPTNYLMFGFVNETGTNAIGGVTINYDIKRFKQGTNYPCGVTFYYSTDGADWTQVSSGDVGPYPASPATTNYLFATMPEVSNAVVTISGLNISAGSPLYLCWQFIISGQTGGPSLSANILALDDFNITVSNVPPPVVVPPPTLQNTFIDAEGNFDFSWETVSGATYQVQFCADLTQPDWINYGPPILATNSTLYFSDPPAEDIYQRFYRVIPVSP